MAPRKYDKDDVLKYVYGELSPSDEGDFIEAMCSDEELFEYYQEVKGVQENLEEVRTEIEPEYTPSEFAVSEVLNYVRDSRPETPTSSRRLGLRFTAMGMVAATALFMVFTVFVYQSSLKAETVALSSTNAWDMTDLDQRMQMARLNARNLRGERAVVLPVYSNTYRLIQTGDFAPAVQNVVLLSID